MGRRSFVASTYAAAVAGEPGSRVLQMSRKQNVKKLDARFLPRFIRRRSILGAIRAATKLIYLLEHPRSEDWTDEILVDVRATS